MLSFHISYPNWLFYKKSIGQECHGGAQGGSRTGKPGMSKQLDWLAEEVLAPFTGLGFDALYIEDIGMY